MDDDVGDLPRVAESHERPRLSAVGRLPHAVAVRDVAANRILAAADVDDVGRRRRDFDRADRPAEIFVGDRRPGLAGVDRLEDAAAGRAHPEFILARGVAGDGDRAAAAIRADLAPSQTGERRRVALRSERRGARARAPRSGSKFR